MKKQLQCKSIALQFKCIFCKGPFTQSVGDNVASDIALIKLLRFLNKPSESLQCWLQPQLIRYDTTIDADAPNHSLALSVNGP